MPTQSCPVCGSNDVEDFFQLPQVPIHCNILLDSREEALATPRGEIRLTFCHHCSHIYNSAFDPNLPDYSTDYENSLHFSSSFQRYADDLAVRLVEQYDLHGKQIIDIGCGKAEFLGTLCAIGNSTGIGFDPSYVPGRIDPHAVERITIVQDFYSERYRQYQGDFVICRHVLEHIYQPIPFLSAIRQAIGGQTNAILFFEVPNMLYTLRHSGIWDVIYDHYSYFNAQSLWYAFQQAGFTPRQTDSEFGGQFLTIEAKPSTEGNPQVVPPTAALSDDVAAFANSYQQKVALWRQRIAEYHTRGLRAVVWGAGAKGATFLNTLAADGNIDTIVDINPHKQGRFVPGAGQRIIAPTALLDSPPDVVILMNPLYQDEVSRILTGLTVDARIDLA